MVLVLATVKMDFSKEVMLDVEVNVEVNVVKVVMMVLQIDMMLLMELVVSYNVRADGCSDAGGSGGGSDYGDESWRVEVIKVAKVGRDGDGVCEDGGRSDCLCCGEVVVKMKVKVNQLKLCLRRWWLR